MNFIAFAVYQAFGRKHGQPTACCRRQTRYFTGKLIVCLSSSQNEYNKTNPDTSAKNNARSRYKEANGLMANPEKNAEYKLFREHLGMTSQSSKREKMHNRAIEESSTAESNSSFQDVPEENATESEQRVKVTPADYGLFDQLLRGTGGTGRKPVKGSRPFASIASRRINSRKTSRRESEMSKDQLLPSKADVKRLKDNHKEQDISGVHSSENPVSHRQAYDLMRNEFGKGFHSIVQKPKSDTTDDDVTEATAPSVLQERPRHPGLRTINDRKSFPQPSADSIKQESDSGGRVENDSPASVTSSYELMKENFGPGFHHDHNASISGHVDDEKSAQNPPLVLRDHPKHAAPEAIVQADNDTGSIEQSEIGRPISSTPPELKPPPRREISLNAPSEKIHLKDRSASPAEFSQDVSSLLQGNDERVLSEFTVNTPGSAETLFTNKIVAERPTQPASKNEEEDLTLKIGLDTAWKAEGEELHLLSPPSRPKSREVDNFGSRSLGSRRGLRRAETLLLESPKIVRTETM